LHTKEEHELSSAHHCTAPLTRLLWVTSARASSGIRVGSRFNWLALYGMLFPAVYTEKRTELGSSTGRELCWVVPYSSLRQSLSSPKRPGCSLSRTMDTPP